MRNLTIAARLTMMKRCYVIILVLACSQPVSAQSRDPLSAAPSVADSLYAELAEDARLNDVCFISPQRGWAVGDHGTILMTLDGGVNWQLQNTPINCTLRSVQFLNESFGIAVGNYWFPLTGQGRGVILTTEDGGRNWHLQQTPNLPPLYHVKIFGTNTIIVAGATSEYTPSGLLLSRAEGNTKLGYDWRPYLSQLSDGFAAVDFHDMRTGIGIGFHGIPQQIHNNISASLTTNFGQRQVTAVKANIIENAFGITNWAVGERGLLLYSVDRGYRWGSVAGALPGRVGEVVDLKTIEAHGNNLWAAGNPGTNIYKSNDAGQTWRAALTGVTAAIRKIVFADTQTGWAVSDLGTILSTRNGGETWHIQRTGNTKLAVLGLFGETETIPYEAFAALSANQGYLSGCILLFRNEKNCSEEENRFHESLIRVGGSLGAELGTLPILPRELWTTSEKLVEHIQKATDGRGMVQLRERLVATIRQWKPEIVLTSNYTNPYTDSAVEELTQREVLEAVKLAADPAAYPHHLTELGLAAWSVKKICLAEKGSTKVSVQLTPSEPTIRFGTPLEEMTYISRSLMETKPCPPWLGFMVEFPNTTENGIALTGKDFFAGIPVVYGSEGRRVLTGAFGDVQSEGRQKAIQRRNVLGMLQSSAKLQQTPGQPFHRANLATNAAELTLRLDADSAVQLLLAMAQQFHEEGDWHAATETYLILTKQHARHPLVRQAYKRLMQYFASGEIIALELKDEGNTTEVNEWVDDPNRPGHRILKTTVTREPIQERFIIAQQRERALLLGRFLEQNHPDLADEISMRFAGASVMRRGSDEQKAARYYQNRSNLRYDDVWSMRARTELWLTSQDSPEPPMPVMVSRYAGVKPYLDGQFDGEKDRGVWQRCQVYSLSPDKPRQRLAELLHNSPTRRIGMVREERLRTMSKNFGTQVMFFHDAEYWYIGLRCPKVPGFEYLSSTSKHRLRDGGHADQDRVEILIDLDRDYTTYYSLTIDSNGGVTDACFGDRNWNPQWHVARHEDESAWYIEAAVPLSALHITLPQQPMMPNTIWGVAIRRLVPNVGIECWNAENSFDLTEGFGLLVFP